jgi:hypothetical protein
VRLPKVETGHAPAEREILAEIEAEVGHVDGVDRLLFYRPDLFGHHQMAATEAIVRRPSEWSVGERELFAAFVSGQNQCPF